MAKKSLHCNKINIPSFYPHLVDKTAFTIEISQLSIHMKCELFDKAFGISLIHLLAKRAVFAEYSYARLSKNIN